MPTAVRLFSTDSCRVERSPSARRGVDPAQAAVRSSYTYPDTGGFVFSDCSLPGCSSRGAQQVAWQEDASAAHAADETLVMRSRIRRAHWTPPLQQFKEVNRPLLLVDVQQECLKLVHPVLYGNALCLPVPARELECCRVTFLPPMLLVRPSGPSDQWPGRYHGVAVI